MKKEDLTQNSGVRVGLIRGKKKQRPKISYCRPHKGSVSPDF
jgi:hypothetical protein